MMSHVFANYKEYFDALCIILCIGIPCMTQLQMKNAGQESFDEYDDSARFLSPLISIRSHM